MSLALNWNLKTIRKSLFNNIGSLQVEDADLPEFDGKIILPPYIEKEGLVYRLHRRENEEEIKAVIVIPSLKAQDYIYLPHSTLDEVGGQKSKDEYENFLFSISEKSANYERILEEIDKLGAVSTEVDMSGSLFLAEDKPVVDLIRTTQEFFLNEHSLGVRDFYFGKQLKRILGSAKDNIPGLSDDLYTLEKHIKRGLQTELDLKEAWVILNMLLEHYPRKPLPLLQLQALLWYRIVSVTVELHNEELMELLNSILKVDKLMRAGCFVTDFGSSRMDADNPDTHIQYLLSLIIWEAYRVSTGKVVIPLDFSEVTGFSPKVANILNRFFSLSEKMSVIVGNSKYPEQWSNLRLPARVLISSDLGEIEFYLTVLSPIIKEIILSEPEAVPYLSHLSSDFISNLYKLNNQKSEFLFQDLVTVTMNDNSFSFHAMVSVDKGSVLRTKLDNLVYGLLLDSTEDGVKFSSGMEKVSIQDEDELSQYIKTQNRKYLEWGYYHKPMPISAAMLARSTMVGKLETEVNFKMIRFYKILDVLNISDDTLERSFIKSGYLPASYGLCLSHMQSHFARMYGVKSKTAPVDKQEYRKIESQVLRSISKYIKKRDLGLLLPSVEKLLLATAKDLGIRVSENTTDKIRHILREKLTASESERLLTTLYLNLCFFLGYAKPMANNFRFRPVLISTDFHRIVNNHELLLEDLIDIIINPATTKPYRLAYLEAKNDMTVNLTLFNLVSQETKYVPGFIDYNVTNITFDRDTKTANIRTDTTKYIVESSFTTRETNIDNVVSFSRLSVDFLKDVIKENTKSIKNLTFSGGPNYTLHINTSKDEEKNLFIVLQSTEDELRELILSDSYVPRVTVLEEEDIGLEEGVNTVRQPLKLSSHYISSLKKTKTAIIKSVMRKLNE